MIEEMRLRDLGVIAEAVLPIGPGFTAITGETGAGKTMVVTGLGLLLGARADSGAVRAGAAQASVAGVWIVPSTGSVADTVADAGGELEPYDDARGELYVSRTLTAEGRSRASVGGRAAPAGVLADLADDLVVVHGQSEQLRLRSAAAQRDALDRFGGSAIALARSQYEAAWEGWRALSAELEEISGNRERRQAEAEDLRQALALIEATDPQPGRTTPSPSVRSASRTRRSCARPRRSHGRRCRTRTVATTCRAWPPRPGVRSSGRAIPSSPASPSIAEIGYRATDIAAELSGYLADLDESGPHELAAVEERRSALAALVRAHGTLDAALELWNTGSARLAELDDDSDHIERLAVERDAARAVLDEAAAALTAIRTEAAGRLGAAVTEELHALAMPDARLVVSVAEGVESAHGRDDVAILLAPHPGAEPRSVAKGASGGELSRVMLAIEVVIAGTDPVPTFVFDEVDAGIGGAAAIEVGRRLARLARTSQVIAVTHLAQVAAFANNHLSVVKANDGQVTASSVRRLDGEDREAEMARLLSGLADSGAALEHARELLALRED